MRQPPGSLSSPLLFPDAWTTCPIISGTACLFIFTPSLSPLQLPSPPFLFLLHPSLPLSLSLSLSLFLPLSCVSLFIYIYIYISLSLSAWPSAVFFFSSPFPFCYTSLN